MKKLAFFVVVGLMVLTYPLLSLAAPVGYQGPAVSASINCRFVNNSAMVRRHIVAKNKGRLPNVTFSFDNVSGIVSSGKVVFENDGFWAGFSGTAIQPNANKFMGTLPVSGVLRLDGDVTFDLNTLTYTGSGHVVEFSGDMNFKGMLRRGMSGGQGPGKSRVGMLKMWITPNVADIVTVTDGVVDTSAPIPASLRISLPAVQLSLTP